MIPRDLADLEKDLSANVEFPENAHVATEQQQKHQLDLDRSERLLRAMKLNERPLLCRELDGTTGVIPPSKLKHKWAERFVDTDAVTH